MFKLLERVHQKSEATRRRMGIAAASAITVLIILVWVTTIGPRASSGKTSTTTAVSPFQSIRRGFSEVLGSFGSKVEDLKEAGSEVYAEPNPLILEEDLSIENGSSSSSVQNEAGLGEEPPESSL